MTGILMTFEELCAFLKADQDMVLALIEAGAVPPPLNVGDRLVRWVQSDLIRWVQMGCPNFPAPTHEELALIRANRVEKVSIEHAEENRPAAP
ncbi:MAG: hypothetical protein ABFC63_00845 [Thermoguttaceae bacterium]